MAPRISSAPRIASLDLLRGLAAFAVAISHYLIANSPGHSVTEAISILAVECFFVLSGFVLAPQILLIARSREASVLLIFLTRRWMRTVPPYLFALAVISLIAGQLFTSDFLRYMFYVQNLTAAHNVTDYFPVAWSLSVEEWFYVLFALLIFAAAVLNRGATDRFVAGIALAFILTIVACRLTFGDYQHWDEAVRRVVIFRLDSIAVGFLLYFLIFNVISRTTIDVRAWALLALILLPMTIMITLYAEAGSHPAAALFCFAAPVLGASAVGLFFHCPISSPQLVRFCIFLGRISYSVYLFHFPLLALIRAQMATQSLAIQLAVYLLSISAFSTVFYFYFERPILSARPNYRAGRIGTDVNALA